MLRGVLAPGICFDYLPVNDCGNMKTRTIAAFDFDGTLTTRDTFPAFVWFACGRRRFITGFLRYSPQLILMKLHLYSNGKVKQRIFSHFFKGWDYDRFRATGEAFVKKIETIRNEKTIQLLEQHLEQGHTVYVVTGSILDWVQPWCEKLGIHTVIATEVEVDDRNVITGRFKTPNCYGQEKVKRLLQLEPARDSYRLYAYGDSHGDKQLLAIADHSTRCH